MRNGLLYKLTLDELGKLNRNADPYRYPHIPTPIRYNAHSYNRSKLTQAYEWFRDMHLFRVQPVRLHPFSKHTGRPVMSWRQAPGIAQLYQNDPAAFSGDYRLIAKVQEPDKLICKAMAHFLYALLEDTLDATGDDPALYEYSYAYRRSRDGHGALTQLEQWAYEQGYSCVARTDVKSYFDCIRMDVVEQQIGDLLKSRGLEDDAYTDWLLAFCFARRELTWKVRQCRRTRVYESGITLPADVGIPQGNPLSAPLANLYLTGVDRIMSKAGVARDFKYLRYADDIVICTRNSEEIAREALDLLAESIVPLGLELGADKTYVDSITSGFIEFLGFQYLEGVRGKRVAEAKYEKFRTKIARLTSWERRRTRLAEGMTRDGLIEEVIPAVNRRVLSKVPRDPARPHGSKVLSGHSFIIYYRHGEEEAAREQMHSLDGWIRRRVAQFVEGPGLQRSDCLRRFFNERLPAYNRRMAEGKGQRLKLVPLTMLFKEDLHTVRVGDYGV